MKARWPIPKETKPVDAIDDIRATTEKLRKYIDEQAAENARLRAENAEQSAILHKLRARVESALAAAEAHAPKPVAPVALPESREAMALQIIDSWRLRLSTMAESWAYERAYMTADLVAKWLVAAARGGMDLNTYQWAEELERRFAK